MEDNKHHHGSKPETTVADDDMTSAINEVKKEETYLENTLQIKTDIANASIMLSYILDKGLDIDKKLIECVVDSKNKFKQQKWTTEAEIEFYLTYKELTKIIQPVTVDSLASSRPSGVEKVGPLGRLFGRKTRGALTARSSTWYMMITGLVMFLLLGVHIYFFLGSTRLDNINECNDQIDKLQSRMYELQILTQKDPDNQSFNSEFEDVVSKLEEYNDRAQSNVDLLGPWVQNLRSFTFNTTIRTDTIAKNDIKFGKANTAIIQEARSYRLILGTYLLPLLYGIIGGFTFVLRELTSEIKTLTFSTGSNIKYILRILLGAIAGLAIGLFWGDIQNTQQLGALSPMLIAFIAGYCVEYLLQFIDRTTKNFFSKSDEKKEAEPAKAKCCCHNEDGKKQ